MTLYKIEENIPPPFRGTRKRPEAKIAPPTTLKGFIQSLKIGQSFVAPNEHRSKIQSISINQTNVKIATQKISATKTRFWRVA